MSAVPDATKPVLKNSPLLKDRPIKANTSVQTVPQTKSAVKQDDNNDKDDVPLAEAVRHFGALH